MYYYVVSSGGDVIGAFTKLSDAKRLAENEECFSIYRYEVDVNAETIRKMLAEEPYAKSVTVVAESEALKFGGNVEFTLDY